MPTRRYISDGEYLGPLTLTERTAPGTPASGKVLLYANADGHPHSIDDAGVDFDLTIAVATKGFVNHGSTAGTARPSGYASIEWYGSVAPTNAVAGDTWIDTSA